MDIKAARLKAKELVGNMTVEEKASQLLYNSPAIERLGKLARRCKMRYGDRFSPFDRSCGNV